MSLRVDWNSYRRVMSKIDHVLAEQRKKAAAALREEAQQVFKESQEEVPVASGALKRSGHLQLEGTSALIVYDQPYAMEVHEDLTATRASGKAKFLEDPVKRAASRLAKRIADKIRV